MSEATFQYKIKNVSKMQGVQLSLPCYIRSLPWRIEVIPMEKNEKEHRPEKFLGVYVSCYYESDSTSWSCSVNLELRLLSCKKGQKPFIRPSKYTFF